MTKGRPNRNAKMREINYTSESCFLLFSPLRFGHSYALPVLDFIGNKQILNRQVARGAKSAQKDAKPVFLAIFREFLAFFGDWRLLPIMSIMYTRECIILLDLVHVLIQNIQKDIHHLGIEKNTRIPFQLLDCLCMAD